MTQLRDVHVKDSVSSSDRQPPHGRIVTVAAVALLAFALGVYWFLARDDTEEPIETVVEAPREVTPPSPEPVVPDPEPIEIPALNNSDGFVRNLVEALSSHPELTSWLVNDGIIRRFVVVIDNIADGTNPAQHITFLRPQNRFTTTNRSSTLLINPDNYRRYDLHAEIIDSLNTQGSAELFHLLEPLITEAYVELGNPDRPFLGTFERAVINLLDVPIVDTPPALVKHPPFFHFTDEILESLSPAQKQFLGMGPNNVRTMQAKIRQIALAIGIADSQLP
tara:strand:- start:208 stop:1044 length:837 start_codon:yes stop_codon:yes gene_type:complete